MFTWLFWTVIAVVTLGFVLDRWLDYLNQRSMSPVLPKDVANYYDEENYRRAYNYQEAHHRLSNRSSWLNFLLLMSLLLTGGFGFLNGLLSDVASGIWLSILFFGVIYLITDLIQLPFSLIAIFKIEEEFGFNRQSIGGFITDKLKSYALTALLGIPLIYFLIWLMYFWGDEFWLYALLFISGISLFVSFFYTSLIIPIFNKLSPIDDDELHQRIIQLCDELSFPVGKVLVMNASKRSSKANAFFSGFGSKKRIVLYDTLLEQHDEEEILAVLAHEIGHYKHRHQWKSMAFSLLVNGVMLFLLSRILFSKELSEIHGVDQVFIHLNLLTFGVLYGPVSLFFGLGMNALSRKHEYEADAFAAKAGKGEALKRALIKLSIENLSNLKPHPFYVWVHYSHPTLLQRLDALDALIPE